MDHRSQKRGLFRKIASFFSADEAGFEVADEDADTFGTIVEVVKDIDPDNSAGRISLRGTTWNAMSVSEVIPAGARARVLYRENLIWVVETYVGLAELGEKD